MNKIVYMSRLFSQSLGAVLSHVAYKPVLLIIILAVPLSCSQSNLWDLANKDVELASSKAITSFRFLVVNNSVLSSDINCSINDAEIGALIPYAAKNRNLIATFTTTGSRVAVNGTVQQSGISANNFSSPVTYTITAEDGTVQDYKVVLDPSLLGDSYKVALQSVASDSDTIDISWRDPDVTADFTINIYDEQSGSLLASVAKGVQSHTFESLTTNTYYSCHLRVVDKLGDEGTSVRAAAYTDPAGRNYILIHNAAELDDVRNDLNAHYIVVNEIDLSSYANWNPIGFSAPGFRGTFEGNGYEISSLTCIGSALCGLFGIVDGTDGAQISNVVLTGVEIQGSGPASAALAANLVSGAVVTGCSVSGTLSASGNAGAIAGSCDGTSTIERCSVVVDVTINTAVGNGGGITGSNTGAISDSSANIEIQSSGPNTGGLCGINSGTVNGCSVNIGAGREIHSTGENTGGLAGLNTGSGNIIGSTVTLASTAGITGSAANTGGFIGECNGTAGSSHVYGNGLVSSTAASVGGFAGYKDGGAFTSSDAHCRVSGSYTCVGGFIGSFGSAAASTQVTSCSSYGDVYGAQSGVGGFVGTVEGNGVQISDSHSHGNVSGGSAANTVGGFAGELLSVGGPYTITNSTSHGNVTGKGLYTGGFIGDIYSGCTVSACSSQGSTVSVDSTMADKRLGGFAGRIALDGAPAIGISDSYSTSNVVMNGGSNSYAGGFAGLIHAEGSYSSRLTVSNSYASGSVSSNTDYTGGFAGYISSSRDSGTSISGCHYESGSVSGGSQVGGFAGRVNGSGSGGVGVLEISGSHSECPSVSGTGKWVGGFIGFNIASNDGTSIDNSYSACDSVSGSQYIGGFAGQFEGSSSASISVIQSNSRCTNISGQSEVGGFVGKVNTIDEDDVIVIANSYSVCDNIDKTGSFNETVGGFAGFIGGSSSVSFGQISECAAYGSITMTNGKGGGFAGGLKVYHGVVSNCYTFCNVSGGTGSVVGGFTGYIEGTATLSIQNSYSSTVLSGPTGSVGGFVGQYENGTFTACYYDRDRANYALSASGSPSGITYLTTTQMRTQSIFVAAGWDFGTIWEIDNNPAPPSYNYNCPYLQAIGYDFFPVP